MRCIRPPTRISKNSSRLRAVMARNFTRSRRGLRGFSASSSTRRLNASHEASRLSTKDGSSRERLTIEKALFGAQVFLCYTKVTKREGEISPEGQVVFRKISALVRKLACIPQSGTLLFRSKVS